MPSSVINIAEMADYEEPGGFKKRQSTPGYEDMNPNDDDSNTCVGCLFGGVLWAISILLIVGTYVNWMGSNYRSVMYRKIEIDSCPGIVAALK